MATAKQMIFNNDAQQKMLAGIEKLSQAVVTTLGPRGGNVAIDKSWGAPAVLHDGVSVAKEINLEDPYENMGAQLVKEAASKTNDVAGDGTTTATLLAHHITAMGIKNIAAGANPMMIKKGIDLAVDAVVAEISKLAKPVKQEDWVKVATISAQNEVIGKKIAEALKLVGKDGVVEVEEGKSMEIEIEHTEGMAFDKGYVSAYFVTNADSMEALLEDPYILITDQKISAIQDLLPFLEKLMKVSKNLVLIADDVDGEALSTLVVNKLRGVFNVLAVKAPGFGDRRKEMLQDIAVLTGGEFISADTGRKLESVTPADCGRANSVRSTKDMTTIVGGKGKKTDIDGRIAQIKKQMDQSTSEFDKEKLQERLAKLSGGVAVIKVGAATEVELKELQERVKDAKEATRAAIEEGVIPGGGVTYLRARKVLNALKNKDEDVTAGIKIVHEALAMPVRKLAENSGADGGWVVHEVMKSEVSAYGFNALTLEFGDMLKQGVIDPAKVAKHALRNAASVAGMILTTRALITDVKEDKKAGGMGASAGDMGMM
ncbi:MAG TPA: chaperonin GroEL [Candidatus Pacebacteria bacterium]|nr:MAG: 60 kDa chaperonin [Microgenomates group bacterium GW2011_GWB1_45_17]KKU23163.1 MAG: 60 kDa chaperonin [Microgenomates group bacterium GW2011_GWA1_46_15]KKU23826.1 MAG: chaperonin GroEL, chaperonin GroEL [Microgenomates group bacterium GW2011_GWC1_46_15]HAV15098.1 chaperonin GroEL [Candidatus Paceibacterota bacterium]HCR11643.1 chaperonin GroEL [Candidatus Paceibacterota bacterium]